MEPNEYRVHQTHCCKLHGCKYGDPNCPVANGNIKQDYVCHTCYEDGIESMEELEKALNPKPEIILSEIFKRLNEIRSDLVANPSSTLRNSAIHKLDNLIVDVLNEIEIEIKK